MSPTPTGRSPSPRRRFRRNRIAAGLSSALTALFLVGIAPAVAEELEWMALRNQNNITVIYAVPHTDFVGVRVSCDFADQNVAISMETDLNAAQYPDYAQIPVIVTSTPDLGAIELTGVVRQWEEDSISPTSFIARAPSSPALTRLLTESDQLYIEFAGQRREFDMAGAQEMMTGLTRACAG